jgi:hypothetical protein
MATVAARLNRAGGDKTAPPMARFVALLARQLTFAKLPLAWPSRLPQADPEPRD